MGFTKPDLPKVDPGTFMQQPLMHRMKVLALHWVRARVRHPADGARDLYRRSC